ncbi:hypothetical protein Slala03_66450 [Streptomyces lavendulae subsp. lavendulae]|uniref:hypothetical protein n=1 Tax=Streptomyces lavendulae TaxID=1914 RepID=UPI0024A421F7|nr:hypothetical protein [Streptomyces lavendulae]GLV86956.1 hypothetical protein Slala03_66450 [Streptomyces lavendulae subsp. lavendulae]
MNAALTEQRTGRPAGPVPLFRPVVRREFADAVREFLDSPGLLPVPVPTEDRADLAESVELAGRLYGALRQPHPLDVGIVLGAAHLPEGLAELARPFARAWADEEELADLAGFRARHGGSLLIVGRYDRLTLDPVRALLMATYRGPRHGLTLLSGRDDASVCWNVAKQYAEPALDVDALGLFTDTDRPPRLPGVQVFDDRDFERADIQAEILGTRWRRVGFQGHGKDDSVNLGEFTICGLNATAPAAPGLLGPRCAYGLPCYKPEDKLVPLNRVEAVELVLSACNSGPLADLALYDPKYQLLLNALDGPARTVVSAVSVHDSDRPENVAWMHGALVGADSVDTLNASLAGSHPYPAFMRFGLPGAPEDTPAPPAPADHRPDPLLLTAGARLTAYLASDLLPHNHALRPRLTKLARKVDLWVARPTHLADQSPEQIEASLTADLQSLDHVITEQVAADPETELMNYPAYFGDRSSLDPDVREVTCHCGRPAQEFTRRGLLPHVLDTTCAVCMRCGDVTFRIPDSPALLAHAPDEVAQGGVLEVRATVTAARTGPVRLGLFVPTYLRADTTVEPATTRLRLTGGRAEDVAFRVRFDPGTAPQAYYFTVFAVQDLAVSTARRHFGVVPRTT